MIDAGIFWNKVAAKYAKSPIADMKAYEYTLGRTRSYLKPSDRVLEVGCGTGATALLLADGVAQIVATDLASEMVAIGAGNAKAQGIDNVEFRVADVASSGQPEEVFDAVLAHNLLHLIEDLDGALAQIYDQLKPGGVFISKSVCAFGTNVPLKMRLIKALLPIMQWLGKAPFVVFRTIEEHEAAITRAGFKIVETGNYPAAPPSRYVVAIRPQRAAQTGG